ncbi:hypothetical protein XELAEV_18010952mg [Xenopus laevis]|uniref:Secreted protein n=1 Tax=Xenopus laevis TaxID=8355 RepID=A0A974DXD2_XENLA|nr:hypothetical protein XELAEV_18010952mg [Xenopus laevis]
MQCMKGVTFCLFFALFWRGVRKVIKCWRVYINMRTQVAWLAKESTKGSLACSSSVDINVLFLNISISLKKRFQRF